MIFINLDETVACYRNGQTEYCGELILHHLPLIKKLSARYVSLPLYPYEDIVEIASFALVKAVCDAKSKLKNNNLKYFIISRVKFAIIEHVCGDHIMIGTRNSIMKMQRVELEDNHCCTGSFDTTVFWEAVNNSIENQTMCEVVMLRFEGYTFKEIVDKIPGTYEMSVLRLWKVFKENMRKNYYANACL